MDYGYEHASYRRRDLIFEKEDMLLTKDKKPSGYARPEFEAVLPRQTLLLDREKVKK
jgi:formate hydrogenlyase subunit 6/NADH:ubiquinone oxidoreductase subunit I